MTSIWDVFIPLAIVLGPFAAFFIGAAGTGSAFLALVRRQPPTLSVAISAMWLLGYVTWTAVAHVLAPFFSFDRTALDALNSGGVLLALVWAALALARTSFTAS